MPAQQVFQLRIQLNDAHVPIWRRILVPGTVRLSKLHDVLQTVLGWQDSHLHVFDINGASYGMHADDYPDDELNEREFTVLQALVNVDSFTYNYDFGDGWEHTVTIENKVTSPVGLKFAVCLDGAGACPPEDCGGVGGYERLLEVLSNPAHEDYDAILEWAGGPIDPLAFDVVIANARLQRPSLNKLAD